jgi:hypothetical protein
MTFEKFYFITKLCEKYNEVAESPTYEDMFVTARVCWGEFSESKYYRFQINKEGIGPAVEEYITENLFPPTFIYQRIKTNNNAST